MKNIFSITQLPHPKHPCVKVIARELINGLEFMPVSKDQWGNLKSDLTKGDDPAGFVLNKIVHGNDLICGVLSNRPDLEGLALAYEGPRLFRHNLTADELRQIGEIHNRHYAKKNHVAFFEALADEDDEFSSVARLTMMTRRAGKSFPVCLAEMWIK